MGAQYTTTDYLAINPKMPLKHWDWLSWLISKIVPFRGIIFFGFFSRYQHTPKRSKKKKLMTLKRRNIQIKKKTFRNSMNDIEVSRMNNMVFGFIFLLYKKVSNCLWNFSNIRSDWKRKGDKRIGPVLRSWAPPEQHFVEFHLMMAIKWIWYLIVGSG